MPIHNPSQEMQMPTIPINATRVVVRARHSLAFQVGPNEARSLTPDGVELCRIVRRDYVKLIAKLEQQFGPAMYASSPLIRAVLSTCLITGAKNVHTDQRLAHEISIKKSPAPAGSSARNLYDHFAGMGYPIYRMIEQIARDPSLLGDQPYATALNDSTDFIRRPFDDADGSRLVFAFGHESIISLTASRFGASSMILGLKETQAVIFYLDDARNVIDLEVFKPECTM